LIIKNKVQIKSNDRYQTNKNKIIINNLILQYFITLVQRKNASN